MTAHISSWPNYCLFFPPLVLGHFSLHAPPESVFPRVCAWKQKPSGSKLPGKISPWLSQNLPVLHLNPTPRSQQPPAVSLSVGEGHCWGSSLLQIIEQLDSCSDDGNLKLVFEIQSHFLSRPLGVFYWEHVAPYFLCSLFRRAGKATEMLIPRLSCSDISNLGHIQVCFSQYLSSVVLFSIRASALLSFCSQLLSGFFHCLFIAFAVVPLASLYYLVRHVFLFFCTQIFPRARALCVMVLMCSCKDMYVLSEETNWRLHVWVLSQHKRAWVCGSA